MDPWRPALTPSALAAAPGALPRVGPCCACCACCPRQVLTGNVFHDSRVVNGLLCELSLWMLIYTESCSMRHTSELMWFIYWCLSHSYIMADF